MRTDDASDKRFPGQALHRLARALLRFTGRVREVALPIVAKGCVAAMTQPSPTTGFLIGVALELGRHLARISAMETLLLRARAYGPANRASCLPPWTGAFPTLNDEMERHDEHPEE